MGVVYRASHAMLRRPTALKLLAPEKAGLETIARFEREVCLTARLTHPNTITIFDYGRTPEGIFYYAMELLEGANLEEVVEVGGAMPAGRVIHVASQIAGALVEAHGAGLIHRDIKPANVILCERGGVPDVVKVVDFGLVREVDAGGSALSRAGAAAGTPLYLAPEAMRAPEQVDARADLYALGCVMYYLLVGDHVFRGRTTMEVCAHHLHTEPTPVGERAQPAPPGDLGAVVMACLKKDPAERLQSAAEILDRLQACADAHAWSAAQARTWWSENTARLQAHHAAHPSSAASTLAIDLDRR
jgi:serine/threonine protein kinase